MALAGDTLLGELHAELQLFDLERPGAKELLQRQLDELRSFTNGSAPKRAMTRQRKNYDETVLIKESDDPTIEDKRIGPGIVVGLIVEAALKLEFKPSLNSSIVPLEDQLPQHHPFVTIHNVILPGQAGTHVIEVMAFHRDAELGIRIACDVVAKLRSPPLESDIVVVDHPADNPHDAAVRPRRRPWRGMYHSLEVKCRSVKNPRPSTFDWKATLRGRVATLWDNSLVLQPNLWISRILFFVELSYPVHPEHGCGNHTLHAAKYDRSGWCDLWGWEKFNPPLPMALPAAPAAKAMAKAPAPLPPKSVQWTQLKARLHDPFAGCDYSNDVNFVKLAPFLRDFAVGQVKGSGQTMRYVGPDCPRWKASDGNQPSNGIDWRRESHVPGGAGYGQGPVFCKVSFLEHVFLTVYAK
jgi:hypothetical protein